MGLSESLLFYSLVGVAVAAAVAMATDDQNRSQQLFQISTALLFWPLYLPILLTRSTSVEDGQKPVKAPKNDQPQDELSARIAQVEDELDAALSSLDGWAEEALAHEHDRMAELRSSWRAQATRVREMDQLLASIDNAWPGDAEVAGDVGGRARQSDEARRQNLKRLHEVRKQAYEDLTATLAKVRELVSMIHLAKHTGAPASRAENLVTQIAAAVEGLSEVAAWSDPPVAHHPPRLLG